MPEFPNTPDDAKRLRMELQRISRETLPELRAAFAENMPEESIVNLLASRVQGGLDAGGGQLVDVPAALAAPAQSAPAQAEAAVDAGLASSVAGIQAQLVLMARDLSDIARIAKAWQAGE